MENIENLNESKTDAFGRNTQGIYCMYCPSKILNPGAASLTNIEFSLPPARCKRDEVNKWDKIHEYWLIEDINTFENIGVSHSVENIKFLVCADCEQGPVGWHDLSTFCSYIALSRVKYQK